jgi:hypothetical protein
MKTLGLYLLFALVAACGTSSEELTKPDSDPGAPRKDASAPSPERPNEPDAAVTRDSGGASDGGTPAPTCVSTEIAKNIGSSVPPALALFAHGGDLHVAYTATLSGAVGYTVRAQGTTNFSAPIFHTVMGAAHLSLAKQASTLRLMASTTNGAASVYDLNGSTWTASTGIAGNSGAFVLEAESFVDSAGVYHAATIFSYAQGLYFKHLSGAQSAGFPKQVASNSTLDITDTKVGALAFRDDGSLLLGVQLRDGSVGLETIPSSGLRTVAALLPVSASSGTFALAPVLSGTEALVSTSKWSHHDGTTATQVSTERPAVGRPQLLMGKDGILRAVVFVTSGMSRADAVLLTRSSGAWQERFRTPAEAARIVETSSGTAMLARTDGTTNEKVLLIECPN